ncbi:MAG: transcriptional regulator, partial [Chloroflexi bacterium]|nr:transcriptional regulator [Chloroflexota bacterium]
MAALNVLECCPPLSQAALSPEDADRLATLFKVLGDSARLRLLSLIQAQPGGEAC